MLLEQEQTNSNDKVITIQSIKLIKKNKKKLKKRILTLGPIAASSNPSSAESADTGPKHILYQINIHKIK